MKLCFAGRVVLVTGASKGIGAACARLFGALEARVAVPYRGDTEGARATAASIRATVGEAEAFEVFAASDLASFMTGEIINVNGGAVLCG